jgi:hypothetical protein
MLTAHNGAGALFTFTVDDPTTLGLDDFTGVTWLFRILGADAATVDIEGTCVAQTVTVTLPASITETLAPGLYRTYLAAQQTDADDIVASEDMMRVRPYPTASVVV